MIGESNQIVTSNKIESNSIDLKGKVNLININDQVIGKLGDDKLTTDHLFILQSLYNKQFDLLDIYDQNFSRERAINNYQTLERKQFIVPDPSDSTYYKISLEGIDYYLSLQASQSNGTYVPRALTKKEKEDAFKIWWDTYPASTDWTTPDGRRFIDGRSLHTGKVEENRLEYNKIMNEGKFTANELLLCLKYEIAAKKKQSLTTGENCLRFMIGSLKYLEERRFENFILFVRNGESIDEAPSNIEVG